MTLGELKEQIDYLVRSNDENVLEMEVYAHSDYGDHCHTEQLLNLGEPQIITPRETAYSDTGLAMPDRYEDDEDEDLDKVIVF